MDVGVLLAEGRQVFTSTRCSCERESRRLEENGQGPAESQGGPELALPSLASTKPLLAEAGRGIGGDTELLGRPERPCRAGLPRGLQHCRVALPPLLHLLLEMGVHTLELPGRHGERHRASSSGSDRDRQCRLVGGAAGGPVLSRRSKKLPTSIGPGDASCHLRPSV